MKATDPNCLIPQWVKEHTTFLRKVLAALGVKSKEDRADLCQEVFYTAYRFLENGHVIENPPAFLYECAKKQASNYRRKASRRAYGDYGEEEELYDLVRTPEQLVSASELVELAHEHLDEKARSILFEVSDGGSTWRDMARARGITVDQARYLHERAVARVAEAAQPELKKRRRRALTLLPALDKLFGGAPARRAERSPGALQRLWSLLQRPFQQVIGRPRFSALALSTASLRARSSLVGVLAGGLVIGSLLPRDLSDPPRPEAAPAASHAEHVSCEPLPEPTAPPRRPAIPGSKTATLTAATTPPVRRSAPARQASSTVPVPITIDLRRSMTLLDTALREYGRGHVRAALALLVQHESRFPVGPDTERRRSLTRLACAATEGAQECSRASHAPRSTAGL